MEISSNLTLELSNKPFLLEKRIELLNAIQRLGSISKAAKAVPMSYKSAWEAIDSMNNLSSTPIVAKETGGSGGGGSKLTPYGQNLLKTYKILKIEQQKFLDKLTSITDIDKGTLKTIGRLSMQISARNQIAGKVVKIVKSAINTNVVIVPKSGHELFANIATESLEDLDIKVNQEVIAIFKSTNVLIATDENIAISARNQINGTILHVEQNNTNSQITLDIGEGQSITSIITTGAVKKLGLEKGQKVVAFIKSNDIILGK